MRTRGDSAEYALTQHQVKEVQAACQDLTERVVIGCLLFLGLRISELVHLRADWITNDWNLRIPTQQACNCAECARYRSNQWRPKTKAGARTLPVPHRIRKDLTDILKIKPNGLGISRIGLYYMVKRVIKRSGVKHKGLANDTVFPHALRATCFNMLVEAGITAPALAYYAGWSNIAVASHYITISRAKSAALKEVSQIFG